MHRSHHARLAVAVTGPASDHLDGFGGLGIALTGDAVPPDWWALGGARWSELHRTIAQAPGQADLGLLIAQGQARGR